LGACGAAVGGGLLYSVWIGLYQLLKDAIETPYKSHPWGGGRDPSWWAPGPGRGGGGPGKRNVESPLVIFSFFLFLSLLSFSPFLFLFSWSG
jgi:hypothetical protein